MVMGCLISAPLRERAKYLGGRKRLPLRPPTALTREDRIFAALRRLFPKPQARGARENVWILGGTWRILNERVSARRDPEKFQSLIRRLGREITARLKGYRRRRAEEAKAEVETLLGSYPPIHREAWLRLNWCYQAAVDRAPPPTQVTLERITAERVNLYSYLPPLGAIIPISVDPFTVDESVPT